MEYRDTYDDEKFEAEYDEILSSQREIRERKEQEALPEQKEEDQEEAKKNETAPHIGEGRRIVAGGLTDLWNSVVSIPKFFDKKFYQPSDPLNPYKFDSPLLINYNPIMKTQWGKFLRPIVEFGGGFALTGGVGSAIPKVKTALHLASKTTKGQIISAGLKGAVVDVVSNRSQEQNLTASLIEWQPKLAPVLQTFATRTDSSPASNAFKNTLEGISLGILWDVGLLGAGKAINSTSVVKNYKKAINKVTPQNEVDKILDKSRAISENNNNQIVEDGAKKEYELSIVKEQSPVQVFHGTSPEAAKLIRSSGVKFTNKDYGVMGEGFYVTTDEAYSTAYGPEVIEGSLPKSAKILDITDQNAFQWAKKIGIGEATEVEDLGHIQEHFSYEQKDQIVKWAKDNNYDGIKFDPYPLVMGEARPEYESLVPEIVLFNKNLANKVVKKVDEVSDTPKIGTNIPRGEAEQFAESNRKPTEEMTVVESIQGSDLPYPDSPRIGTQIPRGETAQSGAVFIERVDKTNKELIGERKGIIDKTMARLVLANEQLPKTYDLAVLELQELNATQLTELGIKKADIEKLSPRQTINLLKKNFDNVRKDLLPGEYRMEGYSESRRKLYKKWFKDDPDVIWVDRQTGAASTIDDEMSIPYLTVKEQPGKISERSPNWDKLPTEEKNNYKRLWANKNNIDWGEEKDLTRRMVNQEKANKELASQQLEEDLIKGKQRNNPAYIEGGDITDNQALSNSYNPGKSVRDMFEIRNKVDQKWGSPNGVLTEAFIRKLERLAPNLVIREIDSLANILRSSPEVDAIYASAKTEAISNDIAGMMVKLATFIDDSGHSRLSEFNEEDILKFIKSQDPDKVTQIEGLPSLNLSQVLAADLVLGQLLYEARDLAKSGLSVMDQIDISADGSILDGILARYAGAAKIRKQASKLASYNLRMWSDGTKGVTDISEDATTEVVNFIAQFKKLLKEDVDDNLMEAFLHFTASSNGSTQGFKDFTAFMKSRLYGYTDGQKWQRNAIVNELQTMGVSSMLSGPKTPVRALIGTGLGTMMRPVATMIGALGDDQTLRGAASSLAAMIEARNDAWKKAVTDFQIYNTYEEGFRGFTPSKSDREWDALGTFFEKSGEWKDKAAYRFADQIRNLNKSSFLNYGPRTMKAMDTFFTQLIGRARLRQLAFDEVWDTAKQSNKNISDLDMGELIKAAEVNFEGKVFSKDGQVSDELALFAADEAKLTAELPAWGKHIESALERLPFLKPFFLFTRTGYNSLKMTSKYTPGLNLILQEHRDILTKAWDDPKMINYGIKSQRDLDLSKAALKGRLAIGTSFTSMAAIMALNGQITGNGPPDRQLRNSWMQALWQPRSLKVGNTQVSLESIEPFNMFFTFVADVVDSQSIMGEEWSGNWFGKLSHVIAANVKNKSFLAGLMQFSDMFLSEGAGVPRVAANFVNAQVPWAGLRNEIGKVLAPGMRELETGFWQSIGNRNLWADVFTNGDILPFRYDILNGDKIRDWDPMTRFINGVLPFNISVGTNPTRELLFRSGINFKQTFNTGPDGQSLEGHSHLKSKFQYYLGNENVEAQLKELFEKDPDILESIEKMESDLASGNIYEASSTYHAKEIQKIFFRAKMTAWGMLLDNHPRAKILDEINDAKKLADRNRISRYYDESNALLDKVKELEKKLKKTPKVQ